ncbi:MAG: hypothetical protein HY690_03380 [Chloroflexi bacterium]|nr:hypothetical protein [Chloroflexota bacterium]
MPDVIIKTGDMIKFNIPPPVLIPPIMAPIPLVGSGSTVQVMGQPICLFGDELPKFLQVPLPYTSPPFVIPGMGTLKVILLPANMTQRTINGKPILIKGGTFPAMFQVQTPAQQITPVGPIPDPVPVKVGTAQFIPTYPLVQAG